MNDPCIFCEIASRNKPSNIVFEDDEIVSFLDIRPVNEGHILIIPKTHHEYMFDLDDAFMSHMLVVAKRLSRILKLCFEAPRIGLVIEGFGVPHLHLHLIPIYRMGDLDPHRAKSQSIEDLEATQRKILSTLAKVGLPV
jgi:histidine triad (HIT) family protein